MSRTKDTPPETKTKNNEFLAHLQELKADNRKFFKAPEGHNDWSFKQLVECIGYTDAMEEVNERYSHSSNGDSYLLKSYELALLGKDSGPNPQLRGHNVQKVKKNELDQEKSIGYPIKMIEEAPPPPKGIPENIEEAPQPNQLPEEKEEAPPPPTQRPGVVEEGAVLPPQSSQHSLSNELTEEAEAFETEFINQSKFFKVQKGNKWIDEAKQRPIPKMLFDSLWYEGEICILFADTNLGKSILAVQIGEAIAKGHAIHPFRLEAQPQKVIYFDFELSDKQFEGRYSEDYKDHYTFSDNFFRAEIDPDCELPEEVRFEDYLNDSLEKVIIEQKAKVLIIDNLTYLKNETEKAKNALPLMKFLKKLKEKYNLSILVLAHTPKRDLSKPITRNDISGSKMLINFCDSSFTIGESHKETGVRYLKQIKVRSSEFVYDAENVAVCRIIKVNSFLGFEFIDYGYEADHLKTYSKEEKEQLEKDIIELYETEQLSYRKIAERCNINHVKVQRVLKKAGLV